MKHQVPGINTLYLCPQQFSIFRRDSLRLLLTNARAPILPRNPGHASQMVMSSTARGFRGSTS